MEAASLMNAFPCLVIRGICDYADAHKNDRWQRYASATAAAYAKELLAYVPAVEVQETKRALEALHLVHQKLDHVEQTTTATKATIDYIRSSHHNDRIERWLRPPDPSTNASHARRLRHEGTGAWVLDHPVFQSWKAGSRQHVWLYGLAGCGKTVLSTTVLDHLEKRPNRLLLCFFFDFSDTSKQSVDGMLRSLAFQLYQTAAVSVMQLDALYGAHHDGCNQPTTETLLDVVCKMLACHERVAIILDALDESTTRSDLVSSIKDIASRPELRHVQLICTSRPEAEFQRNLPELIGAEGCLKLDKHAIDKDIQSYVAAQLIQRRDFQDKRLSRGLIGRIQSKVGAGADGMFRWAFCQLDALAQCLHETAMENALACLPRDLDETYRRMLESLPAELKSDALRLLKFLVHSEQPLLLAEAVDVIATQIEGDLGFDVKSRLFREADVLKYCPNLVVVVHADVDELHLSHFSVKEYLLGIDQMKLSTASISITMTCLAYLTGIEGNLAEIKRDFPMAQLAASVWTSFAASAEAADNVLEASVRFLEEEATFQRWCRLYQQDRSWNGNPGPPEGSRLYYACLGGLFRTTRVLLDKGADVNTQGGEYGNALAAASFQGCVDIVELLLKKGADVNTQGGEYGNALTAASFQGHVDTVKLLLEKGADVNTQDDNYGNALAAASSEGHVDTVKLLLEKGADVNTQDDSWGNALAAASFGGHVETVRLLLEEGADVNEQGGRQRTALAAASSESHVDTVKLLLEKGADIHAQGGTSETALQAASFDGSVEIVNLLLEKGAEVNTQSGVLGNALQAASLGGNSVVVKLLLQQGADVNTQGGYYGNALQAASSRGRIDTVKLLLEKGADINTQGGRFGNALQGAISDGRFDVVKLLLNNGAAVNMQRGTYGDILQTNSLSGHGDILRILQQQQHTARATCRKRPACTLPAGTPNKIQRQTPPSHSTS